MTKNYHPLSDELWEHNEEEWEHNSIPQYDSPVASDYDKIKRLLNLFSKYKVRSRRRVLLSIALSTNVHRGQGLEHGRKLKSRK